MARELGRAYRSEWLKSRRSWAAWLVLGGAFFTPSIILVARVVRPAATPLMCQSATFWESLWKSAWESMALFLLPLGVVLLTSLMTQLEVQNNTWKRVHTLPLRPATIYLAKLAMVVTMLLQLFVLFNVGIYLAGVIPCAVTGGARYPAEPLRVGFFLGQDAAYLLDCLPIVALQYLLGLQSKNFLAPLGVGLLLWIFSLAVLGWRYGVLVPYVYCGLFYLRGQGRYAGGVDFHWLALAWTALMSAASYLLYATKREKG